MNISVQIDGIYEEFEKEKSKLEKECIEYFKEVGEVYTAEARKHKKQTKDYTDRTGNLRNSNGYGIKKDGVLIEQNPGRTETLNGIKQMPSEHDIELVCGAGMEYASEVQRKGYDVTDTGQLAAESKARKLFKKDKWSHQGK